MYQSIIRDPGGRGVIRIYQNVCGQYSAVTNGSILIVPPGTVAFVEINGHLSQPYGPGRYELFTGVDPFFVRFRNLLTRGDAGITVSVFFISTERSCFMKLGTGEFPFLEKRFQITLKAYASCNLTFSIANPRCVLDKMIGSYNSDFSEEDIEPCLEQILLMPIREAISKSLEKQEITKVNSNLSLIGNTTKAEIKRELSMYGLKLEGFHLTAINVPDTEMQRLYTLEQSYAEGKSRTDLELDHLKRVWNGNVQERTLSEMMTGMPSRGQALCNGNGPGSAGGFADGMAPFMAQMMLMSQMFPNIRDSLSSMSSHTDLLRGVSHTAQENTSSADAPPPMPERFMLCPSCNGRINRNVRSCPICGYRLL